MWMVSRSVLLWYIYSMSLLLYFSNSSLGSIRLGEAPPWSVQVRIATDIIQTCLLLTGCLKVCPELQYISCFGHFVK